MSEALISVRNLGVKYKHNHEPDSILTLLSKLKNRNKSSEFWALDQVSFDINDGDLLYIIGRNGAGKSTLLKVLAETLFPDCGQIIIADISKAFVSMGLGLNGRLNGFENINMALNILKVPKHQIQDKTNEIIEFTQLREFIYDQVNYYSSGMRARLGFAIATSITPQILLMDEVISAGDEQFREACQKRVNTVLERASCVVICTHQIRVLKENEAKAIWLDKGRLMAWGDSKKVAEEYLKFVQSLRKK